MKKLFSSLAASAICLSTVLPAFAGSASLGGGPSNAPITSGARIVFLFTNPAGNNEYSITLSPELTARLASNLPSYQSGEFGQRIQLVSQLLFPSGIGSSGDTVVTIRINNLGNAIANFNASLNSNFIRGLSDTQLSRLTVLSEILKELRRKVDEEKVGN
ncbi:MAG: hypothetical protein NW214_13935 [Pseudanabaenaceae cyanobacterium bins.39]|nr:hypothetical protein [Pseudanabaenaceae cyanobacterium bins.39]